MDSDSVVHQEQVDSMEELAPLLEELNMDTRSTTSINRIRRALGSTLSSRLKKLLEASDTLVEVEVEVVALEEVMGVDTEVVTRQDMEVDMGVATVAMKEEATGVITSRLEKDSDTEREVIMVDMVEVDTKVDMVGATMEVISEVLLVVIMVDTEEERDIMEDTLVEKAMERAMKPVTEKVMGMQTTGITMIGGMDMETHGNIIMTMIIIMLMSRTLLFNVLTLYSIRDQSYTTDLISLSTDQILLFIVHLSLFTSPLYWSIDQL